METGFVTIIVLVSIQLVSFAFGYGKIVGKVNSIDKRLNDLSHRFDKMEDRVGRLEGRKP